MLKDLIQKNRSYRRFYEDVPIPVEKLKEFIDMARLSASARNAQSMKYIISNDPAVNKKIFPMLAWAGYLKDWPGPVEGERYRRRRHGYLLLQETNSQILGQRAAGDIWRD